MMPEKRHLSMGRLIFPILLLSLLGIPAFGQIKSFIRAGVNYSTVESKNLNGIAGIHIPDPLLHVHGGFSVEWFFFKKISLLGGIHYSVKGFKNFHETNSIPAPKNLHLKYLAFPFTINYSVFENFYIGAGIEFDYQLSDVINPPIRDLEEDEYFPESINHDLGLLVGIRYQISSIEIGWTGCWGLVKIADFNDNGIERYYKSRNLQVHIAYFFQSE